MSRYLNTTTSVVYGIAKNPKIKPESNELALNELKRRYANCEIEDKMKARVYELIGIDDTDYDAIAEHKAGLTGSHLD